MHEQNVENYESKQFRRQERFRKFWMVYILTLSVLVFWSFYRWSQNGGNLDNALLHLGMIFIGLGNIFMNRNTILQYVFLGLGLIISITSFALIGSR